MDRKPEPSPALPSVIPLTIRSKRQTFPSLASTNPSAWQRSPFSRRNEPDRRCSRSVKSIDFTLLFMTWTYVGSESLLHFFRGFPRRQGVGLRLGAQMRSTRSFFRLSW